MTIMEIVMMIMGILGILIIIVAACADSEEMGVCAIILLLGWVVITIPSTIVSNCHSEFVITAQHETSPLFKNKTSIGYIIITNDNMSHTYTDYKDVAAIENGAKFYKTYYHEKVNFGLDSEKFELIIK